MIVRNALKILLSISKIEEKIALEEKKKSKEEDLKKRTSTKKAS